MLRFPQFPEGVHVRTCQECGHQQVNKDPSTRKSEEWRDVKCRACKSPAMDFGQSNMPDVEEE